MPQLHSSAEQNVSYNVETLHHARGVKSPTVVIFEDTKHIAVDSLKDLKSPTTTNDHLIHF